MGMLWVVCGAGKGVGKTRLARSLCRVLPGSLRVKKGGHSPKPGKKGVYFQKKKDLEVFLEKNLPAKEHLVVESNSLAMEGRGDLVIYLGALAGTPSPRKDRFKLARCAHVRLGEEPDLPAWRRILQEKLPDPVLAGPVLEVLAGMFPRGGGKGFTVKTKLWLHKDGGFVLGPGLAGLLEAVERLGSLRKAAAERGISYRHSWDLLRKAEANLGEELLSKRAGGPGGGGSCLSPAGSRLLEVYGRLEAEVEEHAGRRLDRLLGRGEKKMRKEAAR